MVQKPGFYLEVSLDRIHRVRDSLEYFARCSPMKFTTTFLVLLPLLIRICMGPINVSVVGSRFSNALFPEIPGILGVIW